MSQQKWYWALDYFNNTIDLKRAFPPIRRMSSKCSRKQHTFANLSSKHMCKIVQNLRKIFTHFRDIVISVLKNFILNHPASTYTKTCLNFS